MDDMQTTYNSDQIAVSIICNVYNHERYIRDALEGFIQQKTTFPYEIIVHDDASTDNSASIILEYASKYPQKIIARIQTENQYSKGIHIGETFIYPICKGKYIALCEGDDYWTASCKLQRQYDALEKHHEIDMCAHSADIIDALSEKKVGIISPSSTERILSLEEVIWGGGSFLATNSLFFRKEIVTEIPPFRKNLKIDYTVQINGALRGGIYFLPENMSVYRYKVPGSWTDRIMSNNVKILETYDKIAEMLVLLDEYTSGKYSDLIQKTIKRHRFGFQCMVNNERKLLGSEYRDDRRALSWKGKILFYIKVISPRFGKWLQKVKYKMVGL